MNNETRLPRRRRAEGAGSRRRSVDFELQGPIPGRSGRWPRRGRSPRAV